jgi:hypothetical protein
MRKTDYYLRLEEMKAYRPGSEIGDILYEMTFKADYYDLRYKVTTAEIKHDLEKPIELTHLIYLYDFTMPQSLITELRNKLGNNV